MEDGLKLKYKFTFHFIGKMDIPMDILNHIGVFLCLKARGMYNLAIKKIDHTLKMRYLECSLTVYKMRKQLSPRTMLGALPDIEEIDWSAEMGPDVERVKKNNDRLLMYDIASKFEMNGTRVGYNDSKKWSVGKIYIMFVRCRIEFVGIESHIRSICKKYGVREKFFRRLSRIDDIWGSRWIKKCPPSIIEIMLPHAIYYSKNVKKYISQNIKQLVKNKICHCKAVVTSVLSSNSMREKYLPSLIKESPEFFVEHREICEKYRCELPYELLILLKEDPLYNIFDYADITYIREYIANKMVSGPFLLCDDGYHENKLLFVSFLRKILGLSNAKLWMKYVDIMKPRAVKNYFILHHKIKISDERREEIKKILSICEEEIPRIIKALSLKLESYAEQSSVEESLSEDSLSEDSLSEE